MKNIYSCLYVFFFISCNSVLQIRNGVATKTSFYVDKGNQAETLREGPTRHRIYFLDSMVIYEQTTLEFHSSTTDTGIVQVSARRLRKYTYMDLRTYFCQDYYDFSDTAKPKLSYKVDKKDIVSWNFYADRYKELGDEMRELSDTVMADKEYKRILISLNHPEGKEYYIYYLDCKFPKTIFHVNKSLEEKYVGCVPVRVEFPIDSINGRNFIASEFKIERTGLSEFEKKVFKAWEKNAKDNNLPTSSYQESHKIRRPD